MKKHAEGMPLKKGQLVRVEDIEGVEDGSIFEVEMDVEKNGDFNVWGSVRLKGLPCPIFTHKGGIEVLKTFELTVTSESYCVELDEKTWDKINDDLQLDGFSNYVFQNPKIYDAMEKRGAIGLEWNGHFGMAFYFTCEVEDRKEAAKAVRAFLNAPVTSTVEDLVDIIQNA